MNRTPSKVINFSTPLECLFEQKPNYSSLRIFGCACWPNLRPFNSRKLKFRPKQCAFLGYSTLYKGFKCLDIFTGRVHVSRDVIFDENVFPFSNLHSNAGARLKSEIILHPTLFNPSNLDLGGEQVDDQFTDFPSPGANNSGTGILQNNVADHVQNGIEEANTEHELDASAQSPGQASKLPPGSEPASPAAPSPAPLSSGGGPDYIASGSAEPRGATRPRAGARTNATPAEPSTTHTDASPPGGSSTIVVPVLPAVPALPPESADATT